MVMHIPSKREGKAWDRVLLEQATALPQARSSDLCTIEKTSITLGFPSLTLSKDGPHNQDLL